MLLRASGVLDAAASALLVFVAWDIRSRPRLRPLWTRAITVSAGINLVLGLEAFVVHDPVSGPLILLAASALLFALHLGWSSKPPRAP